MITSTPRVPAQKSWQRRSSPLSRYALIVYASIVIDASLFPFTGWRDLGFAPFDYLVDAWPPRILPFDIFVNALGYAPLGALVVLAIHPRVRGTLAVVVATLFCVLLSANLEAVQTYLPVRVASKVDLIANAAGGILGSLVAARFAHALLDTGRLRGWRNRWFAGDASRGLVLSVVWFGALVYPDVFAFGTGGLLKVFDPESADRFATWFGLVDGGDADRTAMRFQYAETVVSALAVLGSGLLLQNLLRPTVRWSSRIALVWMFVLAAACIEALAHAFLFNATFAWPPLTPGSRVGILVATCMLSIAIFLPATTRWALGLAALVGAVVLVNVYPDNPYVTPVGLAWTRGRLMNFYGLASGLNLIWPWLAVIYLLRHPATPAARQKAPSRSL